MFLKAFLTLRHTISKSLFACSQIPITKFCTISTRYYGNGKTGTLPQFYDVDLLDDYIHTAIYYQSATALLHPEADVWLGETSSLYDGGTPHLSDSFVAGFM